jgi:hypothetical protein
MQLESLPGKIRLLDAVTGENKIVSGSSDRSQRAPRLSVLLASEAPVGMVFRRGPTKLVRVFLWDRECDKFKPCQWFKGRIFAEQSDLSPDVRYMIYFAMGGGMNEVTRV